MQSQVRFNRVPEKVPEEVWEALVQSQVKFNSVPERVPEKVWEALVQNQVRFNRGSGEASGEGLGGFGAEPGQVQQGSGEKVPEKVLGGFGQGQVGFNRVPGKSGRLCKVRFNRLLEKVPEKV